MYIQVWISKYDEYQKYKLRAPCREEEYRYHHYIINGQDTFFVNRIRFSEVGIFIPWASFFFSWNSLLSSIDLLVDKENDSSLRARSRINSA